MKFTVEVTSRAEADLREIFLYIARDSPTNGERWLQRVGSAIRRLEQLPTRCRRAPESKVFRETVRQLLVGNYRILFTVRESTVFILHVRHAARRPLRPNEL